MSSKKHTSPASEQRSREEQVNASLDVFMGQNPQDHEHQVPKLTAEEFQKLKNSCEKESKPQESHKSPSIPLKESSDLKNCPLNIKITEREEDILTRLRRTLNRNSAEYYYTNDEIAAALLRLHLNREQTDTLLPELQLFLNEQTK
jgi:chorismate mutase